MTGKRSEEKLLDRWSPSEVEDRAFFCHRPSLDVLCLARIVFGIDSQEETSCVSEGSLAVGEQVRLSYLFH